MHIIFYFDRVWWKQRRASTLRETSWPRRSRSEWHTPSTGLTMKRHRLDKPLTLNYTLHWTVLTSGLYCQVQCSGGAHAESKGNPGGLAGSLPVLPRPGGGSGLVKRQTAPHRCQRLGELLEQHSAAAPQTPGPHWLTEWMHPVNLRHKRCFIHEIWLHWKSLSKLSAQICSVNFVLFVFFLGYDAGDLRPQPIGPGSSGGRA